MATQLHEIVAVEPGARTRGERDFTMLHQNAQKEALLNGLYRHYQPKDDEGERFPDERTNVVLRHRDVFEQVAGVLTGVFDVVATKEYANQEAAADVVVDGVAVLEAAPVTLLLYLERKLTDLHTFVAALPTVDPARSWTWNEQQQVWQAEPVETFKTRKIPTVLVKYPATDKHPAQTEVFPVDETIGTWTTVIYSGATSLRRRRELLDRVNKLTMAVQTARAQANETTIVQQRIGQSLLGYVFGPGEE